MKNETTKFKQARINSNLKQHEVAYLSNNTLRMVETFEQGCRDINKANISSVVRLAYAMKCKLQDILEDEEVVKMLNDIYK
jgi:hypothetical protein